MAITEIQSTTDNLNNAWNYFIGQCTRFVAGALSWIPAGLGNARDWYANAQRKGLPVGQSPAVGSVAVWGTGDFGHVAEVVGIIPGGFRVAEENFLGPGRVDLRDVTTQNGLIGFIHPPGTDLSKLPVVGGVVQGAQDALSTGAAIAKLPVDIGHGIAGGTQTATHNAGVWFRNNIVGLVVALVVALVIFAPGDVKEGT